MEPGDGLSLPMEFGKLGLLCVEGMFTYLGDLRVWTLERSIYAMMSKLWSQSVHLAAVVSSSPCLPLALFLPIA